MQGTGKLPPLEVEGYSLSHPFWRDINFIPDWLHQRVVYNNAEHPMLKEILEELRHGDKLHSEEKQPQEAQLAAVKQEKLQQGANNYAQEAQHCQPATQQRHVSHQLTLQHQQQAPQPVQSFLALQQQQQAQQQLLNQTGNYHSGNHVQGQQLQSSQQFHQQAAKAVSQHGLAPQQAPQQASGPSYLTGSYQQGGRAQQLSLGSTAQPLGGYGYHGGTQQQQTVGGIAVQPQFGISMAQFQTSVGAVQHLGGLGQQQMTGGMQMGGVMPIIGGVQQQQFPGATNHWPQHPK